MTTKKTRVNAPVVKKSDLSADVLAQFRGRSFDDTRAIREQHIARSNRATRDIVEGKTKKPRALWNDDEHVGQSLFFKIELPKLVATYGDHLNDMLAIPNFGGGHASGYVRKLMGQRANDEGRKKGAFDILYPRARGDWHSLWIESKVDPRKPTKEQREFQASMTDAGNLAIVVYGVDAKQLCEGIRRLVAMYEGCGAYREPRRTALALTYVSYLSRVMGFRAVG